MVGLTPYPEALQLATELSRRIPGYYLLLSQRREHMSEGSDWEKWAEPDYWANHFADQIRQFIANTFPEECGYRLDVKVVPIEPKADTPAIVGD